MILPEEELSVVSGQLSVAEKKTRAKKPKAIEAPAPVARNGLVFDIPKQGEPLPKTKPEKQPKEKSERVKRACDPRMVSAARELRDRWLEQMNSGNYLIEAQGKYDVSRALVDQRREHEEITVVPALPLAA